MDRVDRPASTPTSPSVPARREAHPPARSSPFRGRPGGGSLNLSRLSSSPGTALILTPSPRQSAIMTSEGRDDSRGSLGRQASAWMPTTSHRVRKDRLLEACAKSRRGGETGVSPYPLPPRGSGLAAAAQPIRVAPEAPSCSNKKGRLAGAQLGLRETDFRREEVGPGLSRCCPSHCCCCRHCSGCWCRHNPGASRGGRP